MLTFALNQFGSSFATRERGQEMRETLLAMVDGDAPSGVVVDFSGVRHVSYSFADEFIGRLTSDDGPVFEVVQMTSSVARSIERARERRTLTTP